MWNVTSVTRFRSSDLRKKTFYDTEILSIHDLRDPGSGWSLYIILQRCIRYIVYSVVLPFTLPHWCKVRYTRLYSAADLHCYMLCSLVGVLHLGGSWPLGFCGHSGVFPRWCRQWVERLGCWHGPADPAWTNLSSSCNSCSQDSTVHRPFLVHVVMYDVSWGSSWNVLICTYDTYLTYVTYCCVRRRYFDVDSAPHGSVSTARILICITVALTTDDVCRQDWQGKDCIWINM